MQPLNAGKCCNKVLLDARIMEKPESEGEVCWDC